MMELNATKLAQDCQKKFILGAKKTNDRRNNWEENVEKLKEIFIEFSRGINRSSSYKWINIVDSRDIDIQKDSLRYISLGWSHQPVGLKSIGEPTKLEVEFGASLSIIQVVTGEVLCVFYPAKSEMMKANEDHLLVKGPLPIEKLTKKCLLRILRYFVAYSQVTSFIGSPSWLDRLIIMLLRLEVKLKDKNKMELFGTVIKKVVTAISNSIKGGA